MEIFKQGKLGKNEHDIYDELNNNGICLSSPCWNETFENLKTSAWIYLVTYADIYRS